MCDVKTRLLEEHVRKCQRGRSDNAADVADNGSGGGMATPSWVAGDGDAGGSNGWYWDGLDGRVCGL